MDKSSSSVIWYSKQSSILPKTVVLSLTEPLSLSMCIPAMTGYEALTVLVVINILACSCVYTLGTCDVCPNDGHNYIIHPQAANSHVLWSRKMQAGAGSALMFVSLVGGFGAPRINKVLSSTGYLTSPSKHTYRRLFKTIQMISGLHADPPRSGAELLYARAMLLVGYMECCEGSETQLIGTRSPPTPFVGC